MPQDNLRSAVYKSFVTCDDPRGVVDCRTFRKSNTNSKKSEKKLQHPKMLKKLKNATLHKEKKKEMVSKGGKEKSYKLNQLIDSWSKHTRFDGQSNNIANDMLVGALDLQDSLVMLSKLQEASQHMTKLQKKHKDEPCVGKADEAGVKRSSSDRFGNPRLSDDGSSTDCHEELREVIRNSLARQKLLPPNSLKERTCIHKSKAIYSSSSMSSESTSSWKNPRSSNLIAKLMGLEDFSSKALPKQLQRDSGLTQKPIFDIEMQNGGKPQVVAQKVDRGCMTLENIIDSMQFKGLLKSDEDQTYHPNTSDTERRLSNDAASTIVLIKPTHPGIKAEEHFQRQLVQERATLDSKKKQKFRKTKQETTSKTMGDFNSNELRRKLQSGEPPLVPSMVCNNDNKLTNLNEKSNTSIMDSAPALLVSGETDVAAVLIQENCDDRLITLCKDLMLPIPYENYNKCPDNATDYHQHDLKENIFCQTETTAEVTISRTQESLQEIEPPDNCDAHQLIVLETLTNSHDSELLNSKLLRDCANELLQSRRQRVKLQTIPFLHVSISDSRVCMSKNKLMEEARNEIENLRSCSNQGVHSVPDGDIVFSVLERDIMCKGLVAGAWDVGWREGFTRNEVEQIVSDLDRQVIDQLIEEVLADLVV